jgi:23S rRNA (uridine2552-2'-O)-methyltransferase
VSEKKGEGARNLSVRLKTARKRTTSQQKWLERQLNDPYVARAKREGYRSRAAYKLLEIDDKYKLLKPGQRVVDLGARPAAGRRSRRPRSAASRARARWSASISSHRPDPGVDFVQLDFLDESAPERLIEMLGGPADIVMSDMAANATGHKKTDHLRIMGLAEVAASSPARSSRPAASTSPRCSRAAPRARCSPT